VTIVPLRTGTAHWIGVASVDAAGNRSPAQIIGTADPRFDQSAVAAAPTFRTPPSGYAVVGGRFNDDTFDDIAVAARPPLESPRQAGTCTSARHDRRRRAIRGAVIDGNLVPRSPGAVGSVSRGW
jgi:hypothetical protein